MLWPLSGHINIHYCTNLNSLEKLNKYIYFSTSNYGNRAFDIPCFKFRIVHLNSIKCTKLRIKFLIVILGYLTIYIEFNCSCRIEWIGKLAKHHIEGFNCRNCFLL